MNNLDCGTISFSTYCNHNCLFCGSTKKIDEKEVKKQELTAYKSLLYFKVKGINRIDISGGDPIEYKKIVSFIKYLKDYGFEHVQLSTNGNRLADNFFCKELMSSGLDKIRIPIYGSSAEIHDSITREKGSFKKLIMGVKNLLDIKKGLLEIEMSTLVMNQNKSDLINIVKLVNNSFKVNSFYISTPCLAADDTSFYIPFVKVAPYIKKTYFYVCKENMKCNFLDFPFCIFEKIDFRINNYSNVPVLSPIYKKNSKHKIVDNIPFYRVKKKVSICKKCKASDLCDGFFERDINRFGTKGLKPIT